MVFLYTQPLAAQGFDWEYSIRRPEYAPTWYMAPSVQVATMGHSTDIAYLDQVRSFDPAFICAQYNNGTGRCLSFGLKAEWWKYAHTSFILSVMYGTLNADFSADSPEATLADGNILKTRYLLSTSIHSARVQVQAKSLVFARHGWLAGGILGDIRLGLKSEVTESVVSPVTYQFPGTNSQSKLLSNKDIAGVRSFILNPTLSIGYDLDMGTNLYSAFELGVQVPLMNYTISTNWSIWSLYFQYSLVFGL